MRLTVIHYSDKPKGDQSTICGIVDVRDHKGTSRNAEYQTHKIARTGDHLRHIDCTKCAKALGKKLIKDAGIKVLFEMCGSLSFLNSDQHPNAVYVDGSLLCTVSYRGGDDGGWGINQIKYSRTGIQNELKILSENGSPHCERWVDDKDKIDLQGKSWNPFEYEEKSVFGGHSYVNTMRFASKELAAHWAHTHRDALLTEAQALSIWRGHFTKEDAKANAKKAAEQAEQQRQSDMAMGLRELYERPDLTNFQRDALHTAMEALCIKVEVSQ